MTHFDVLFLKKPQTIYMIKLKQEACIWQQCEGFKNPAFKSKELLLYGYYLKPKTERKKNVLSFLYVIYQLDQNCVTFRLSLIHRKFFKAI